MRFFYVVVAQKNSCGSLATWKFCYKFEIFEICTLYSRSLSFTTVALSLLLPMFTIPVMLDWTR